MNKKEKRSNEIESTLFIGFHCVCYVFNIPLFSFNARFFLISFCDIASNIIAILNLIIGAERKQIVFSVFLRFFFCLICLIGENMFTGYRIYKRIGQPSNNYHATHEVFRCLSLYFALNGIKNYIHIGKK